MTTEGIIQKVVDRYYGRAHINVLEGIKQELIAEIKEQSNTWMSNISRREIELFTKELIGDNQE